LIEIDVEMQNQEVKQRIEDILTSFNLISHWNKNMLKSFVFLIEKYLAKILKLVNGKTKQIKNYEAITK
jgi:dihydroneopterin aldolase